MDLFKPKLSLNGVQLDLPSITEEETSDATEVTSADWLVLAEESIQRDLDASVKELDLIHDVLEDLEIQLRSEEKPNLELEDQKFLMAACQEYSGSRCHMLEERLRQIMLWLSTKKTGGKIPDRVPDEYAMSRSHLTRNFSVYLNGVANIYSIQMVYGR